MEAGKISEILNDLAAINMEMAKAYEYASLQNQLYDVELRTTFALLANQGRQNSYTLNMQVEKLLAKNSEARPGLGALHGEYIGNKELFIGTNRKAMLTASEAGETVMVALYEKALSNKIHSEIRDMLENQLRGMQSALSTIKKTIDTAEIKPISYRR